jgi:hypothetical protein
MGKRKYKDPGIIQNSLQEIPEFLRGCSLKISLNSKNLIRYKDDLSKWHLFFVIEDLEKKGKFLGVDVLENVRNSKENSAVYSLVDFNSEALEEINEVRYHLYGNSFKKFFSKVYYEMNSIIFDVALYGLKTSKLNRICQFLGSHVKYCGKDWENGRFFYKAIRDMDDRTFEYCSSVAREISSKINCELEKLCGFV